VTGNDFTKECGVAVVETLCFSTLGVFMICFFSSSSLCCDLSFFWSLSGSFEELFLFFFSDFGVVVGGAGVAGATGAGVAGATGAGVAGATGAGATGAGRATGAGGGGEEADP
jgi:hypothetical protein